MADPYRITDDWQEGYDAGYSTGYQNGIDYQTYIEGRRLSQGPRPASTITQRATPKKRKKLSAYNKFVSAMSEKPRFKYKTSRGNKKKGMTNLKAIGVAWRKLTPAKQAKWK